MLYGLLIVRIPQHTGYENSSFFLEEQNVYNMISFYLLILEFWKITCLGLKFWDSEQVIQ